MGHEVVYARNGDIALAYQIVGDGPIDLMFVPGFGSNLIWNWELPSYAHLLRRLASFARLIIVDRRGTGLSDRPAPEDFPPLEVLADDLGVILDAVGSDAASVFGTQDGGMTCALFAASHPERVERLILYTLDPGGEQPWEGSWGLSERAEYVARVADGWGTRSFAQWHMGIRAPSVVDDPRAVSWYTSWMQLAASPSGAAALFSIYLATDVQPALASIQVPTLVLHRVGDPLDRIEEGRHVARLIPGGQLVELPGDDHQWFVGDTDSIADAIEVFITGTHVTRVLDRELATVLFTDIVGSTEKLAELGDVRWKGLLAEHDEHAKMEIERHRGRYVASTGDGLLATFDGPARAVQCALALSEWLRSLGVLARAGCHTGEIELADEGVRGIAVHIAARIAALAVASEVLASSTVRDLTAGSGLIFEERGEHVLKGVPGEWHLYAAVGER